MRVWGGVQGARPQLEWAALTQKPEDSCGKRGFRAEGSSPGLPETLRYGESLGFRV